MKAIHKLSIITMSMAVLSLSAHAAHAFGVSGVGGSGGYLSPESREATGAVGVHAELEQPGTKIHLVPGLMYWGSEQRTDVNPNVDVTYHIRKENKITPY